MTSVVAVFYFLMNNSIRNILTGQFFLHMLYEYNLSVRFLPGLVHAAVDTLLLPFCARVTFKTLNFLPAEPLWDYFRET